MSSFNNTKTVRQKFGHRVRKFLQTERLCQLENRYKPDKLIADGCNAPWNFGLWEKTCVEQGVEFYNTREKGALRINL